MFQLIPIAIVALAGGAAYKKHRDSKKPRLSAEREKCYLAALKTLKEPDKLRSLADSFEKEGFKNEASMLRKRATLREMPPDQKAARREAFKKGMKSKNAAAIETLAASFESQGATGAASALRTYAAGLPKTAA